MDIVTLTNKKEKQNKRQVLVQGAVNGNEMTGPSIAVYFIEYLCSLRYNGEKLQMARVNALLDQIELIIVPIVNPVGYVNGEANERITDAAKERAKAEFGRTIDSINIQTDFSLDAASDNECLNSIASRMIYKLM